MHAQPSTTDEQPRAADNETAARILQAADELFGERGFAGVSVRDITERADANKALLFYYFTSKEALFERILERYYQEHTVTLAEAFKGGGTVAERWHRVLDTYLDFIEENRRFPRIVQRELLSGGAGQETIRCGNET